MNTYLIFKQTMNESVVVRIETNALLINLLLIVLGGSLKFLA